MRYTTRIIVPPRIRRSGPPGSLGGAYGPQVLGVRRTFGFGDRLDVATPTHLAVAAAHPEYAPVFVQQSTQEMARTGRSFSEVVGRAARAVSTARFRSPWGADASRLQTAQEVTEAAEAGFTCFTFDPSELVRTGVELLAPAELQAAVDTLVAEGDLPDHWAEPYLDRAIDLPGSHRLRVALEPLQRAVLRYGPALEHCARLSSALARSHQGRPFEVEVALDRVATPATTLEHLFVGLELESRGVRLTGLALRLPEDADALESQLREHAAVAEFCGPYKLVFEEVADPARLYPLLGRICDGALHVKTSAVSYLEALRTVAEVAPEWFREIVARSGDSARLVPEEVRGAALLDDPADRCSLNHAFGHVWHTAQMASGQPCQQAILELLDRYPDLYAAALTACYEQQFSWLDAG